MSGDPTIDFIFQALILIMSVVVHELAHGFAANYLGDPTARLSGRLTLNPLKHLDPVGSVLVPILSYTTAHFVFGWAKPVPYNPYNLKSRVAVSFVAFAGPLANIILGVVFGLILRFGAHTLSPAFLYIAGTISFINLLLAVFNLTPVPPLDGSKVLFNLLPWRFNSILEKLEQYSLFILLVFVFFLSSFVVPLSEFFFRLIVGQ